MNNKISNGLVYCLTLFVAILANSCNPDQVLYIYKLENTI